jgi:hypothetical protein
MKLILIIIKINRFKKQVKINNKFQYLLVYLQKINKEHNKKLKIM